MNIKRIGRTLVCLLLVCCLLVTCPPVQAYAIGVEAAIAIGVPAALVIGGVLVGLGILPGPGEVFNTLVNDIKESAAMLDFIYGDKMDVLSVTNTATGENQYYVSQDVIEAVQDAAWETGAVSCNITNGFSLSAGTFLFGLSRNDISADIDTTCFIFRSPSTSSSYSICLVAFEPFTYYVTSPNYHITGTITSETASEYTYNGLTFYYGVAYRTSAPGYEGTAYIAICSGSLLGQILSGELELNGKSVSVADGLVQGAVVGSNAISLPEAYPDWADKSIEQENHDIPIPYFPLGLGDTYEETISKSQEDVWNGISEYTAAVLDNWTSLLGAISAIKTFVGNIAINIDSWFENVISEIGAFASSVSTWFENVISKIEAIPDAFSQWFEQIIDYGASVLDKLETLAVAIADAFVAAITDAFVLDPGYVEGELDNLLSEFRFLDSMVSFGRGVVDVFYGIGTKPPILYIDLDVAESSIDYGDRVVFLDLTWYERYKPYGDAIISSFLWAFFGWRLLHHLPGLINGSSGIVPHFK